MKEKSMPLDAFGRPVEDGCHWQIRGWKPFQSVRFYVFIHGMMELAQIMFFAYYKSIITQIEKQYKLSAATLGIIDTSNDWSNIMFGVFLAYFGSYVHRPRMMALSSVLGVLGTVIMFLPHYLAEPYQYDGQILDDGEQKESDMCIPQNWTVAMAQESICSEETLQAEAKKPGGIGHVESHDGWPVHLWFGHCLCGAIWDIIHQ